VWFYLNPMANIVEGYRDILMYHQVPSLITLFVISAFSLISIFFGKGIINHFDKVYPRITTQ
jgi:lipopolysaccharide transport system permease protein